MTLLFMKCFANPCEVDLRDTLGTVDLCSRQRATRGLALRTCLIPDSQAPMPNVILVP